MYRAAECPHARFWGIFNAYHELIALSLHWAERRFLLIMRAGESYRGELPPLRPTPAAALYMHMARSLGHSLGELRHHACIASCGCSHRKQVVRA